MVVDRPTALISLDAFSSTPLAGAEGDIERSLRSTAVPSQASAPTTVEGVYIRSMPSSMPDSFVKVTLFLLNSYHIKKHGVSKLKVILAIYDSKERVRLSLL